MNLKNIIEAANITGADSIHPGFGFLSENSQFAKICEESNIKFIGPSYKVIELMGNKSNAKDLMKKAGVPVIPGSDGSIQSLKGIIETANKIGYPILLKASAGGGGKGIRIVNSEEELESNYNIVKQEAKLSFNNDEIYVEKFIKNPRHVEIQVLADEHGNVIHLGERDCSIQRKNQKVIEETPSTILDDKLRNKMGEAAIKAVKASSYTSCGTVEFLVDSDKNFYFMEMNTRIQVEHPITEMRTGIDIVKEQIKIAAGEKLKIKQKNVQFKGHSIECRINAENPRKKFRPSPGKITGLNLPGGNGGMAAARQAELCQNAAAYGFVIIPCIIGVFHLGVGGAVCDIKPFKGGHGAAAEQRRELAAPQIPQKVLSALTCGTALGRVIATARPGVAVVHQGPSGVEAALKAFRGKGAPAGHRHCTVVEQIAVLNMVHAALGVQKFNVLL